MNQVIVLPLVIAFLSSIGAVFLRNTDHVERWAVLGLIAYSASVLSLFLETLSEGPIVYQAGGWPAPFGISMISDPLSALMLVLTAAIALPVTVYSISYLEGGGSYYVFLNFMMAGMTGAFLTADLFNLFVWFEVVLMSSYALVAFEDDSASLKTTLDYVVMNLIGSSLMLVSIGGLYALTGTLNMADIALKLSSPAAYGISVAPALGLIAILFCVFALKSGLAPFHFWVPEVYTQSTPPAAAMMAGVSKKVGIYAVIRLYFTVFSGMKVPSGSPMLEMFGFVVSMMAILSIFLGGYSAISRRRLGDLLSYSSIGQVGFIFLAIGTAALHPEVRLLGLTAAIVYIFNHGLAKSCLLLVKGILGKHAGTTLMDELGGIGSYRPYLAASFFLGAFSLIGAPPLLGFFGKLLVFRTLIISPPALLIALLGGIFTLVYFSEAWKQIFWGKPVGMDDIPICEKAAIVLLAAMILLLGIGFEGLYQLVERAADAAVSQQIYIEAILGDVK